MRVLVAFEDQLRVGGEAIARIIRRDRPRVEVAVAEAVALGGVEARFDPHLVISTLPSSTDSSGRLSWVFLSADPGQASEICVGGKRREVFNPSLGELFSVLDETERLVSALRYEPCGDC